MKRKYKQHLDVTWWHNGKIICDSTTAVSDYICMIVEQLDCSATPNNILKYIKDNHLICYDEIKVMQSYIDKGYGDEFLYVGQKIRTEEVVFNDTKRVKIDFKEK